MIQIEESGGKHPAADCTILQLFESTLANAINNPADNGPTIPSYDLLHKIERFAKKSGTRYVIWAQLSKAVGKRDTIRLFFEDCRGPEARLEAIQEALGIVGYLYDFESVQVTYGPRRSVANRLREAQARLSRDQRMRSKLGDSLEPVEKPDPEFVGREWAFRQLDAHVAHDHSGILFVIGPAAAGKSALLSEWLNRRRRHGSKQLIVKHSFRASNSSTARVRVVAKALAAQIFDLGLEGFSDELMSGWKRIAASISSPGEYIREMVIEPLRRLPAPRDRKLIIAIDALDEAIDVRRALTLESSPVTDDEVVETSALCRHLSQLPNWIRVVVTCRPEKLPPHLGKKLNLECWANRRDLNRYVRQRLTHTLRGAREQRIFAAEIVERTSGNFGLTKAILADGVPQDLRTIPAGLDELFDQAMEKKFKDGRSAYARFTRPVLGLLVAAKEPISASFIARVLHMTEADVNERLLFLGSLVEQDSHSRWGIASALFTQWLEAGPEGWAISLGDSLQLAQRWVSRVSAECLPASLDILHRCCVIEGRWPLRQALAVAPDGFTCEMIGGHLGDLVAKGLIEFEGAPGRLGSVCGGDILEEDRFSVCRLVRYAGIQVLNTAGIHAILRRKVNQAILGEWTSAELEELLLEPHEDLDIVLMDRELTDSVLDGDNEMEKTVLTIQSLLRGNLNLLRDKYDALSLMLPSPSMYGSVGELRIHWVVGLGLYHYVRGDYGKSHEFALKSFDMTSIETNGWIRGAARAARSLTGTIVGEEIPLDQEYDTALKETEHFIARHGEHTRKASYWLGMTHIMFGTAYWHRMRSEHRRLGGERLNPNLRLALHASLRAHRVLTRIGEKTFSVFSLNTLGHLRRLYDPPFNRKYSIEYYRISLDIALQTKNVRGTLGVVHGIAGWLGWGGRSEEFRHLMERVELLYRGLKQEMIPPIRMEYDLLWELHGGKPDRSSACDRLDLDREMKEVVHEARVFIDLLLEESFLDFSGWNISDGEDASGGHGTLSGGE